MPVKGIPMILIYVSDVEESVKWYQETLELPVLYQDQGFASLKIGSQRIGLHTGEQAGTKEGQALSVFAVDEYLEAKAVLESRGCVFHFENKTPNAIFGAFKDPDGNALQIMQIGKISSNVRDEK